MVITRRGCPLHYWLTGPAEAVPLVFTHGLALDHTIFEEQIAALADQFRILAWDLRGHGASQPRGKDFSLRLAAEDLRALLAEANLSYPVLIGHSLGGLVSQEAIHQGAAARGLALIGTISLLDRHGRGFHALQRFYQSFFRRFPEKNLATLLAWCMTINPQVQPRLRGVCRQVSKANFLQALAALGNGLHSDADARLEIPLLLTHGARDHRILFNYIPFSNRAWARRQGGCQYAIIPHAGHNAHQDNPAVFNRILREWLDKL